MEWFRRGLPPLANDVMPDEPDPKLPHPTPLSPSWFDTEVRDIHGWSTRPVAPWRRYFALYLDTMVHGVIGYFMIGYIGGSIAPSEVDRAFAVLEKPGGQLLEIMVTVFLAAVVGAVVVGTTGSSIGKAIFGVKVVDGSMRPIGLWRGLKREVYIWSAGLGFGIPLISLFTLVFSYRRLQGRGTTAWDKGRTLVLHRPATKRQTVLNVIGVVLSTLVLIALKQIE